MTPKDSRRPCFLNNREVTTATNCRKQLQLQNSMSSRNIKRNHAESEGGESITDHGGKRSKPPRILLHTKNACQSFTGSPPSTPVNGALTPQLLGTDEVPSEDPCDIALRPTILQSDEVIAKTTESEEETVLPQVEKKLKTIAGKYQILHTTEDEEPTHIVTNLKTNEFALCREVTKELYVHYMKVFERLSFTNNDDNDKILQKIWPYPMELFTTDDKKCYHVSPRHYGTLHSYVIDKKKLNERETKHFYRQILEIVKYCHDRGIVVRDVKLRKFVFVDEQRRRLRLDDLDELMVCENVDNDSMSDRHGCPAYVSPEILDLSTKDYSGRPADVWGLGVLLYVLLMGRYPFYDTTPSGLFGKIRVAKIVMNEQCGVTLELRWLIRCLLRKMPEERPKVREILAHPWLLNGKSFSKFKCDDNDEELEEQMSVPAAKSSSLPALDECVRDQCVPSLEPKILTNKGKRSEFSRDQELDPFLGL